MDEYEMAGAIAFELNKGTWTATDIGLGETQFTNEHGERFTIVVTKEEEAE